MVENEERENHLSEEEIEKLPNWSVNSSSRGSSSDVSGPKWGLMACEDELDTSIAPGGAGNGLDSKQKMLTKKGKSGCKV